MTLLNFIWRSLRKSSLEQSRHYGDDTWALVTGGSDGIGKGFVRELLSRGFNVLVHGRSPSKLEALLTELRSEYPDRKVDSLCFDASDPDTKSVISKLLTGIGHARLAHLTVVIQNLGYPSTWTPFPLQSIEETDAVCSVQARFPTQLLLALLPYLAKNEPSIVINVGGLTSLYPCPTLAVHSGYKGYLVAWTEAMAAEMRHFDTWRPYEREEFWKRVNAAGVAPVEDINGANAEAGADHARDSATASSAPKKAPRIIWHVINVLNTASQSNKSKESFFTPSPRRMAKASLDIAGCGEIHVTAYWRHAILGAILQFMPKRMVQSSMASEIKELRRLEDESKGKTAPKAADQ